MEDFQYIQNLPFIVQDEAIFSPEIFHNIDWKQSWDILQDTSEASGRVVITILFRNYVWYQSNQLMNFLIILLLFHV